MLWASNHRRLATAAIIATIAVFMLPMAVSFAINMGAGNVANTDGDGLNLRSQPSLSAPPILAMPEGAAVEVIAVGIFAEGHEWARLRYQGIEGYSVVVYLQNSTGQPPYPAEQPPAGQDPPAGDRWRERLSGSRRWDRRRWCERTQRTRHHQRDRDRPAGGRDRAVAGRSSL